MHDDCYSLDKVLTNSLSCCYRGPHIDTGPAPTLFHFCTAARQTLTQTPFSDLLPFLPGMRAFSITLPFHQEDKNNMHVLRDDWTKAFQNSSSFLDDFFNAFVQLLSFLQENKLLIPGKVAASGISRGGFIALHLAARHKEISHILGFAPMTNLSGCPYFSDLPESAYKYNTENLIDRLVDKSLFFLLGNRDTAISAKDCYTFINNLTEEQYTNGVRSPKVFMKVRPSIGSRGHGTPPEAFKEGAEWLCQEFQL